MAQTVVAFFKEASDAQKAVSRLEEKGISRQHVDVSRGEYKDGTADADGRNTNKITDMFNKLFGHDNDNAKRYSTVGQSNVSIVTVHAPSRDLAEEAADVLDDCGAIDVDEHSRSSGFDGSNSGIGDVSDDSLNTDTDRSGTMGSMGNMNAGAGRTGLGSGDLTGTNMGSAGSTNRWRSRIFDDSLEDNYRLRGDQF